jgi:hypothetical protein
VQLARRLVKAVRIARVTDDDTEKAFEPIGQAMRRRHLKPGPASVIEVLVKEPSAAGKVDTLLHRMRATPQLEQVYQGLKPRIGELLASARVTSADRWALVEALGRLDAADILAPYDAFEAMLPAVDGRFLRGRGPHPRFEGTQSLFPRKGREVYWLYAEAEAPPPALDRYRSLVAEAVIDAATGEYGSVLGFVESRPAGARGRRFAFTLSHLYPEIALVVRPPGAAGSLSLRRRVPEFARWSSYGQYVLTLTGAMAGPPGRWTLATTRTFVDSPEVAVRVDGIASACLE